MSVEFWQAMGPEYVADTRRQWLESVMSGAWDRSHPEFTTNEGDPMTERIPDPEQEPDVPNDPVPEPAGPEPEDDASTTEPEAPE